MKVQDLLIQTARVFPNRVAISHEDRRIRYHQLDQASDRVAESLRLRSLDPGTRIALLCENSIEYVVVFFGIFKAGMVAVPLDSSLDPVTLAFVLADSEAAVLVAQLKFLRKAPDILKNNGSIRAVVLDAEMPVGRDDLDLILLKSVIGEPSNYTEIHVPGTDQPSVDSGQLDLNDLAGQNSPHELAAIFYTSGSTGSGKGVMLSHRNLVSNTLATIQYLRLSAAESVVVILPFYYIYGNSLLLTHIACGGRMVIDNRFLYPEIVLDTMEQERVTGFSGVPSHFLILLGKSTFSRRKLKHLRYFTQAGGAMAPETIRKLINLFGNKEIFIMYGQTEAAPRVTWLPPERLKDKVGSIGVAVPGVTIELLDENGKPVALGDTGEIVVSGPNVMMGYWNQPRENHEVLRDEKLHTGDLAKLDQDGYLWVVGRSKEIIKSGGNRVSAKEVEECLLTCDKILEVGVVGVPDDILGEAIRAVVVLKAGAIADAREIQTHCRKNLAEFKVPRQVRFVDTLPKYQSGKINKPLLKAESFGTDNSDSCRE
jgi:long-chain acyl-CoA synthetase